MDFLTLMNLLFEIKKKAPNMLLEPVARQYGQSKVVITLPISDDHAELLIQATKMFAPVQNDPWDYRHPDMNDGQPPF